MCCREEGVTVSSVTQVSVLRINDTTEEWSPHLQSVWFTAVIMSPTWIPASWKGHKTENHHNEVYKNATRCHLYPWKCSPKGWQKKFTVIEQTFAGPCPSTLWIITGAEPITLKPYPLSIFFSSKLFGALHSKLALNTCTGPWKHFKKAHDRPLPNWSILKIY